MLSVFLWRKVGLQLCNGDVHVEVWHDPELSSGQKFPQTKQKTSRGSKIPTEIIYKKLLSVAKRERYHNHKICGFKRQSLKNPTNILFCFPVIPIHMVLGNGHFGVRQSYCASYNWAKYRVFYFSDALSRNSFLLSFIDTKQSTGVFAHRYKCTFSFVT